MNNSDCSNNIDGRLSAVFSDGTPLYRSPSEPDPGDSVVLKIRVPEGLFRRVLLEQKNASAAILMEKESGDGIFEYYRACVVCGRAPVSYRFLLETEDRAYLYDRMGISERENNPAEDNSECEAACSAEAESDEKAADEWKAAFRFTPGFHVPQWAVGAVQYQIFPDRFCNGNPENDVADNEYYYGVGHAKHIADWSAPPDETDIRRFYGGDLQGIASKLDYLQSLGVEVLYLNPIFVSPSSHKYDTQDYEHIDPHLAVIARDMDHSMEAWEKHNGYAPKYIMRTTAKENLEASDAYFAWFCTELHSRGMRLILDGVFNHCGSFSKWMDAEGIYLNKPGYVPGAFQSAESPYRGRFRFGDRRSGRCGEYEGWWGYASLPKLNFEGSPELCEEILSIAEKWARPPYSIDGWRLDVAADLGHSPEFNHSFWRSFRRRLKAVNPNLLIIAEHYGDPSSWLKGDQWDTVMNYDAFMDPVSYFLTGMEKHSDSRNDGLRGNGREFFKTMAERSCAFETGSMLSAMNELSNHDHSRFLTRTNGRIGRMETVGNAAADEGVSLPVMRQAVLMQMTWPGAPTIYYGDEAGLTGWTDPDNRRTYPWGNENGELIEYHRILTSIRKEHPVLRAGSLTELYAGDGVIAYARFDASECVIVALNRDDVERRLEPDLMRTGFTDASAFSLCLLSDSEGYGKPEQENSSLHPEGNRLELVLPPLSAALLIATK